MGWLLVIVTFLGGTAPGPTVQTQLLVNQSACEAARKAVMAQIDEASKSNFVNGGFSNGVTAAGRVAASASCVQVR